MLTIVLIRCLKNVTPELNLKLSVGSRRVKQLNEDTKNNEVVIHTLPHLKCIRLVPVGSSHLQFEMH